LRHACPENGARVRRLSFVSVCPQLTLFLQVRRPRRLEQHSEKTVDRREEPPELTIHGRPVQCGRRAHHRHGAGAHQCQGDAGRHLARLLRPGQPSAELEARESHPDTDCSRARQEAYFQKQSCTRAG
jgi:hypothetical protein